MIKKNFTLSNEAHDLFNQILEQISIESPGITQGEVLAKILQAYGNKSTDKESIDDLIGSIERLESERKSFIKLLGFPSDSTLEEVASNILAQDGKITSLMEELNSTKEELASTKEDLRKSVQERMQFDGITGEELKEVERKHAEEVARLQESVKLDVNQLLLTIPTPTFEILTVCCERLSAKLKKEVKPADLLLDVFVRYNVEQLNEWFYPFVIRQSELKEITGFSYEEIRKWLSNGKEA